MTSALDQLLGPVEDTSMGWPAELGDHLSASRLALFVRCPEQWRRKYVLGERERRNPKMIWGTADHAAHEVNFRQKITTGEDIPVDEVQDAFATSLTKQIGEEGGESEIVWGDETPGALKDAGVQLVAAYHRQVSPALQPLAIEERFEVTVPGVPVPFVGYIDLRAIVGNERRAIERKTAPSQLKIPRPDWQLQGRLYQMVAQTAVDWHISAKTKTPGVYTPLENPGLRLEVSDSMSSAAQLQIVSTVRQLVATWHTFGPDDPWPGDGVNHTWACGYCPSRPTCPYWGSPS